MKLQNFSSAVPVIATADVLATVRYFEQTLGFKQQWLWGYPPIYAGVRAGRALLYIILDPVLASTIKERRLSPDIFLWIDDIDAVYSQHLAANAEITEDLTTRPWGVRQYVVRDPNGYLLSCLITGARGKRTFLAFRRLCSFGALSSHSQRAQRLKLLPWTVLNSSGPITYNRLFRP
jgi:catechol 2,3-dioxygenase-like lactoylglutathione lyase family enzyme